MYVGLQFSNFRDSQSLKFLTSFWFVRLVSRFIIAYSWYFFNFGQLYACRQTNIYIQAHRFIFCHVIPRQVRMARIPYQWYSQGAAPLDVFLRCSRATHPLLSSPSLITNPSFVARTETMHFFTGSPFLALPFLDGCISWTNEPTPSDALPVSI